MSALVEDARTKADKILAELSDVEHVDDLGALVLAALSRQAEGRSLFSGGEVIDGMAAEYGVDADRAQLPSANVLSLLRRGPVTPAEHCLLSALALRGLSAIPEAERRESIERFARHATWLETSTSYRVFALVDRILSTEDAAFVWKSVANAILDEDGSEPAERARNAARISVLSASASQAAREERHQLAERLVDPGARALLEALANPEGVVRVPEVVVHGRLDRAPPVSGALGFLRLASGWALLQWLFRGLAAAVGFRAEGDLELTGHGDVRVRSTTRLLGQVVRESEETLARSELRRVGRDARFPALTLLAGTLSLAVGVVIGGLFVLDGVRGGDTVLLLAGAGLVLGGGLCDLVASVVAGSRDAKVSLFVDAKRRRVRVSGISTTDAERFVDAFGR